MPGPPLSVPDHVTVKLFGSNLGKAATLLVGGGTELGGVIVTVSVAGSATDAPLLAFDRETKKVTPLLLIDESTRIGTVNVCVVTPGPKLSVLSVVV